MPGNLCTAADAVKACVQATLKSKYKTWIELPPELGPAWWKDKFVQPVVLLVKALCGHPDAGHQFCPRPEVVEAFQAPIQKGKPVKAAPATSTRTAALVGAGKGPSTHATMAQW